jgi:hypothetical protein
MGVRPALRSKLERPSGHGALIYGAAGTVRCAQPQQWRCWRSRRALGSIRCGVTPSTRYLEGMDMKKKTTTAKKTTAKAKPKAKGKR